MRQTFDIVRQNDSRQCGPACIAMVCRHYGKYIDAGSVERLHPTDSEGMSMSAICAVSDELGLESLCVRIVSEDLKDVPLPCILHWKGNHYVVLYRISKGRYYIADPAIGKVNYDEDRFNQNWAGQDGDKGIALLLQPDERFESKSVKTAKRHAESAKFLGRYFLSYRKYFAHILLGLLVGCLLQLIAPFLTQAIVDVGIKNGDISVIYMILLGELFIVTGRTVTDFIRRWILLHISSRINVTLVSDFFVKLLRLPMRFFDSTNMGDLMQRMTDHSRIDIFLTTTVLDTVFSLISFAVFGVVLIIYNNTIFIVFLVGAILQTCWLLALMHRRKVLDYETFEAAGRNNDTTYDFLNHMQEIKLQGCGRRRRWEWEGRQADLFVLRMKQLQLEQLYDGVSIFIREIQNIFIAVIAAMSVINGDLSLGGMLAVQYMVGQIGSPFTQLLGAINSCQDVKISLDRINDIHRTDDEDKEENNDDSNDRNGDIELKNIDFSYDVHSSRKVLTGVSVVIPKGKMTAIVGTSGSGKTTLIKLILGFYDVNNGKITIGGNDLRNMNKRLWRKRCGVVMQEGVIFSESIARNIAVDDDDIDHDRMHEAARVACISDFIDQLPLKYNTVVGKNGVGLSRGQMQRLLIARAVYRNPDYMFFDEATNSLDTENERAIVENLQEFYKGRTVVVVAHRLSTICNADNIIVIEDGMIKEEGSHEQLVSQRGGYYNLIKTNWSLLYEIR